MSSPHWRLLSCGLAWVVAASVWSAASPVSLAADAPTVTREKLLQAVEEAKQGRREELAKARQALQRPGRLRVPPDLLPDFVALLKDDDTEIQLVGALGLRILKASKSKDALVEYLKAKDFKELDRLVHAGKMDDRRYSNEMRASGVAVLALGDIGDKSVIPLLESLRGVKDLKFEFGGGPVQEALARLGAEGIESLSSLGPNAKDRDLMAATKAIRGLTDPKKIPALIATVKNEQCDIRIRGAASGALAQMKGEGVDTLPFLVSVIKDTSYPRDLRKWTIGEVGAMKRADAETALSEIMADPGCEFKATCLVALQKQGPDRYFPEMMRAILDRSAPIADREEIAQGLAWAAERGELNAQAELMVEGLKAARPDGSPADRVRIMVWKAYNRITGKEPRLEVSDVKPAADYLRGDIFTRLVRENVHASAPEVTRMVGEKIDAIVVQWKPEKGGQRE